MKGILTKLRQVPWGALTVTVIVVIAVLALPIVGHLLWGLTTFKDVMDIVLPVITSCAILIGGFIAAVKLQLFRDFEPHLSISQEVSHRFSSRSYMHIAVTSTLHNSSKVKVEVLKSFCRVQQILPVTDEEFIRLNDQAFKGPMYRDFQWPTLQKALRTWKKNAVLIEPGESHQETYEFMIGSEVRSILAYTYIYNSRRRQGSQAVEGWLGTTVYDIATP